MPTLKWIGKDKVINYHNEVPFRLLKENGNLSVNSNDTENLLIKGDNLEALKALLPYYYNKIKAVYIDPPYNTGNEDWVYNDNVNAPEIKKWLGKVVGGEAEDLSRHDKWLCMMYPRLQLLRELLGEDGVIFVSIDDTELSNLRLMMNEIFGEENFLGCVVRATGTTTGQDSRRFGSSFDYLVVYSKNTGYEVGGVPLSEEDATRFSEEDEKGRYSLLQLRKTGRADRREDRPAMYYPTEAPDGTEVFPIGPGGYESRWRCGPKTYERLVIEGLIEWKKVKKDGKEQWVPYVKYYLEGREKRPSPLWIDLDGNKKATIEVKQLLGEKVFDNPKPTALIKRILQIVTETDTNDIILDSFAGSGTTGHAVLALNKEDGGNRRFILVELENEIAENVTAERLKRAIQGHSYKRSNGEEVKVEGLGGGFKFLELGNPLFDKHKQIIGEPSYEDLAGYIYFTETRCTIDWGKANRDDWYVGENSGIHYFMIYGEKSDLDEGFLEIAKRYQGKKIVYADAVMMDDDELERFDIVFKQIPYEIRTF